MMKTYEDFLHNPIINTAHSSIVVKDHSYGIIAASYDYARHAGVSVKALIGLTDKEMPWRNLEKNITNHDLATLCGDNSIKLHLFRCPTSTPVQYFMSHKTILLDRNGDKAGTYTHVIPISERDLKLTHLKHSYVDNLSKKEYEIICLLVVGYKRSEILIRCSISISTYDFHIKNLKKKFHAATTHELMIFAIQEGIYSSIPDIYP